LNNNLHSMMFKNKLTHGYLVRRYKHYDGDPAYGKALDEAMHQGKEIIVVQARVSPVGIEYHFTYLPQHFSGSPP